MRIYTRTGDKGKSSLFDGDRVPKYDLRLMAYGELDHLNVLIGACRALNEVDEVDEVLKEVQIDIMALSSILATKDLNKLPEPIKDFDFEKINLLEEKIDHFWSELPKLTSFILPSGCEAALKVHEARVICRSAERLIVELAESEEVPEGVLAYVNRLSDVFFALARYMNKVAGEEEEKWKMA